MLVIVVRFVGKIFGEKLKPFFSFSSALLDLVEAPGAFIMGCHAQHKTQIQRVVKQMDEVIQNYHLFL